MESIETLVNRVKRSDALAFKELFELYEEDVFNFLYYKLGDIAAAEDILQDIFIKLWENRCQLRLGTSIKSYLLTIANRTALNYIRHNKIVRKFQQEEQQMSFVSESPFVELENKERQNYLLQSIQNLPEKPRVALMLCKFEQMTYKEGVQTPFYAAILDW